MAHRADPTARIRSVAQLPASLRFLLSTKLYWGLALLCSGRRRPRRSTRAASTFSSARGNLSDVLRQVSNNGIVAVGMTLVILTGGIDLSVGSVLALGSVLCAMLLTMAGWTTAARCVPIPMLVAVVLFGLVAWLVAARRRGTPARRRGAPPPAAGACAAVGAGAVVAALSARLWAARRCRASSASLGVLVVVPAVGLVRRRAQRRRSSPRAACSRSSSRWR